MSLRPYLHMYARSNELEERGVINLNAVNVESNPDMEMLLGVSRRFFIALPRSGMLIGANRKSSRLPFSPPPTRTLSRRLARKSFNRGPANSIPRACWPSKSSICPSLPHPHACTRRFFLGSHISSLLEGDHIAFFQAVFSMCSL